ncbi:hypothetical protein AXF41_12245 [Clostridium haemolyticum]|nr:hypothetical protein AXF41_12245 [Clostridium haemolyticum]
MVVHINILKTVVNIKDVINIFKSCTLHQVFKSLNLMKILYFKNSFSLSIIINKKNGINTICINKGNPQK